MRRWSIKALGLGVGTVAAGIVAAALSVQAQPLASLRGFSPLLAIFGSDEARSVPALRENLSLWESMLMRSDLDPQLTRIQDEVLDSLSDFDLEGLHEMLPEKRGPYRELHVRSELKGARYVVRTPRPGESFEVCATCDRRALGDASLSVRSRPIEHGDDTHYLLEAEAGATVSGVNWQNVLDAQHKWWTLLGGIDPKSASPEERPMLAYRVDTRSNNPGLTGREFETLAVLWQSFPFTGRLLRSLGRVEDLWAGAESGDTLHVRASLRMEPGRLKARYPELADWLEDLDALLDADIRLMDAKGRNLLRAHVDTDTLRLRVEFHVHQGQLLPFDGQQVYKEAPLSLKTPQRFTLDVAGQANALGVHAQFERARGTLGYAPTATGMRTNASVTQVPKVTISGAALGFVPIEVIDVFVPDDIHGLAMRFITAAVKGNDGKGIVASAELAHGSDGRTTVQGKLALEALDNFFVRLGVGYWNDHIAPDTDATGDIVRLQEDALSALSADLDGYLRAKGRKAP